MKTTFIYALCEPGTETIRYIGKADRPQRRLKRHLNESINYKSYLGNWLRSLSGAPPTMEILDEVPDCQHEFWEREYIRVFRALGMRLVNTSDGGGAGPCLRGDQNPMFGRTGEKSPRYKKRLPPETCAEISKSLTGRKDTEETKLKKSLSATGKVRPPSHCAALSAVLTGRKLSPEHCEILRRVRTGRKASEQTKINMKAAQQLRRRNERLTA